MKSFTSLPSFEEGGPCSLIIDFFLMFFHDVGEDKGMVLSDSERKCLIARSASDPQVAQVAWTPKHEWDDEKEREKILDMGGMFSLELRNGEHPRLYHTLLGISCIFAQEFTS
jgi:hypothetical protein